MTPRDALWRSVLLLLVGGLAFHACPAEAALTVRYADFDLATGLNDGTSEANAWQTWAAMEGGLAAGHCVNIQQTSARDDPGADIDITVNGTSTAPILLVGYKTTAGDCGATSWGDGGDSGISNYFQSGAGNRLLTISGNNYWVRFFDWTVSRNFNIAVTASGAQIRILNSHIENTNTGEAAALNMSAAGGIVLNSRIKAAVGGSGSTYAVNLGSSILFGSRVDATSYTTSAAAKAVNMGCGASNKSTVMYSLIRGPDATGSEVGIDSSHTNSADDVCLIFGNSFRDFAKGVTVEGVTSTLGLLAVIGNVAYNVGTWFENEDSANAYNLGFLALSNAMQSNTADWTNVSPKPLLHDVDLTADPFTDTAWDMRLNATAGGGAAAKDVAEPVDVILDNTDVNKMDIGAVQSND